MATKIEWCDESRNSIKGCTKISPGCNNCYACELIKKDGGDPHKITFHEDKLRIPAESGHRSGGKTAGIPL